ncbi:diguanylate cyclase domain-containing protein [Pararobbsia alpina]|uniref:diguanylate cyclase domain-containing protein n=1 Tax=Pararobbsia alpina TaxID=621374 RepID=UPI0039A59587
MRKRFHLRSLDHQRPLSGVTMAFSIGAYLMFAAARAFLVEAPFPLMLSLGAALAMAVLVAAIPRVSTTTAFGFIGVAYSVILQLTANELVKGTANPLVWMTPAVVAITVCAAPLWLTPKHFFTGTVLYYAAVAPFALSLPTDSHDRGIFAVWILIALSTAAVFHFGFYRFRLKHFLLEEKLVDLASIDALTSVRNRRSFFEAAEQTLATVAKDAVVAAIFVDIDHFKSLNDQFGHGAGDDVLRGVARTLTRLAGNDTLVGRLGGEEFVVLASRAQGWRAGELAERIRTAITDIRRPDGHVTASIGVALLRDGDTIVSLLDRADEALLRAKHAGRNQIGFERAMAVAGVRETERDAIASANPSRIDNDALEAPVQWRDITLLSHFQPLWSLSHQKQIGVEALLRGKDAHGAMLLPATLFARRSPAELVEFDVRSHECHLRNAGGHLDDDEWLFLNVVPSTFLREGYEVELVQRVRQAGLEPSDVVLELLESDDIAPDELSLAAGRYRDHGFLIAVDDFGAGYSNLDRLLRIQPDFVKLDGELIRARNRSSGRPLLRDLVALLHRADMLVIVEGIETTEELILAVEAKVDFAQGYLLGRPEPTRLLPDAFSKRIDHAFDVVAEARSLRLGRFESKIEPYVQAMNEAARGVQAGVAYSVALSELSQDPLCTRCFVLGAAGKPTLFEVLGQAGVDSPRARLPLANADEGRWDHRTFFWKAMMRPGDAVVSGPQLSPINCRPTIVISIAVFVDGAHVLMAAEMDWTSAELPWPEAA